MITTVSSTRSAPVRIMRIIPHVRFNTMPTSTRLLNQCLILLFLAACAYAQDAQNKTSDYQPSPQNLEARRWFQDAKFGMFIHWGIYSELGDGEWVMERHKIPVHDYEKVAKQF